MEDHLLFLRTLADPTRLKILKLILMEELCVCELQELLQISQPAVSQHITKLKSARLVAERRAGMWTYYRAELSRFLTPLNALRAFLETDPKDIPEMAGETARRGALNRIQSCGG